MVKNYIYIIDRKDHVIYCNHLMLLFMAAASVNIHIVIFSNTAWAIETKFGWSQDGPLQSLMFLF